MPADEGERITDMKQHKPNSATTVATFHTEEPTQLADGEPVVVERNGDETVVRRIPRVDSDDPIGSFSELAAAIEADLKRNP